DRLPRTDGLHQSVRAGARGRGLTGEVEDGRRHARALHRDVVLGGEVERVGEVVGARRHRDRGVGRGGWERRGDGGLAHARVDVHDVAVVVVIVVVVAAAGGDEPCQHEPTGAPAKWMLHVFPPSEAATTAKGAYPITSSPEF